MIGMHQIQSDVQQTWSEVAQPPKVVNTMAGEVQVKGFMVTAAKAMGTLVNSVSTLPASMHALVAQEPSITLCGAVGGGQQPRDPNTP